MAIDTETSPRLRGLILSAYDAGSHRYWREGLVRHLVEIDWTVLMLPARYFSWRIRGNPLSFLESDGDALSEDYDFLIATSMVDLATLRGIVPSLARIPAIVYFHENQFEYPKNDRQKNGLEPQMVNLYSAMAADLVIFNSAYNRSSFLKGCEQLMVKLPDFTLNDLSNRISKKSTVIPVPITGSLFDRPRTRDAIEQPVKLLWNHRWEYDKGPDRLLLFLKTLEEHKVPFKINIVGERFRQVPVEFDEIFTNFASKIGAFGYLDSAEAYAQLLLDSDVVLSTAIHEFQGVAVMEAVASGCIPLVPDRLSYGELVAEEYCYRSDIERPEREAEAAVNKLLDILSSGVNSLTLRQSYRQYSWENLIGDYSDQIKLLTKTL